MQCDATDITSVEFVQQNSKLDIAAESHMYMMVWFLRVQTV